MKFSLCFLMCAAVACGGTIGTVSATMTDAGSKGPICCQITNNFTTDPHWQNGLYICDPDGGVTAMGSNDIPWLCNPDTKKTTCDDPSCTVGDPCLGFNGTGVVTNCQ